MEKKLKPFDLEAALNGAAVVTRSGKQVSELVYLKTIRNSNSKVIASIDGELKTYSDKGEYYSDISREFDLFMKPQQVTKWVNIYQSSNDVFYTGNAHNTKENALLQVRSSDKIIDTVQITFNV